MSCAKTAAPIEMQFQRLSRVDPGNITRGCRCLHHKWHFKDVWL